MAAALAKLPLPGLQLLVVDDNSATGTGQVSKPAGRNLQWARGQCRTAPVSGDSPRG